MKRLIIFLFTLLFFPVFSQELPDQQPVLIDGKQYIMHPVTAGETLYSISRRYQLEVISILNENPQLISGLKSGDVLKIPLAAQASALAAPSEMEEVSTLGHLVQRRETLFSISRQYGVTIDEILQVNPGMGELRRGETIRIPGRTPVTATAVAPPVAASGVESIHTVVQGETLYSISRRYGQTVAELLELNPAAANLQPGMELKVKSELPADRISYERSAPVEEGFIEHNIAPGETLYRLTRQYGVTAERLVELNPELSGTFRIGTKVRIPVVRKNNNGEVMVRYLAGAGDTPQLIAERFGMDPAEVIRLNPNLAARDVLPNDTLFLVPSGLLMTAAAAPAGTSQLSISDCEQLLYSQQHRTQLSMALLLPLSVDANMAGINSTFTDRQFPINAPTDTLPAASDPVAQGTGMVFTGNSENFIHFYEGVLLAVDSLERAGIGVSLRVVDTDRYRGRMQQLISDGHLKEVDLIIGPVQPSDQREIADYAARNQIYMISPLSASDELTRSNPYYFQINPTREIINRNSADYLVQQYKGSNFIMLQMGNSPSAEESALAASVRENLRKSGGQTLKVCEFNRVGINGLTAMLNPAGKNVIILASANEAEVSVGVSNIHTIASQYDLILIGTNRFAQFESINQEYYHRGRLEFLAPYFPEYGQPVTRSFVHQFRAHFKTEPNQFSIQGFDTSFFFLKMVSQFGRQLHKCLDCGQPDLVQGKYKFVKLPQGGYLNEGLKVVSYGRDYKVTGRIAPTTANK